MKHVEPNALLLQVLAHDLLAPLTAVKWQAELLAKPNLDTDKQRQYISNIADSTTLGIRLTKHAHVAASVLIGNYSHTLEQASLPKVLRLAAENLSLQYERHGLSLEVSCEDDGVKRELDKDLHGLLVWSIAKFFLTCAPAGTHVHIEGVVPRGREDGTIYILRMRAREVPECSIYVTEFDEGTAEREYDQTRVFTTLIRTIAPLVQATVEVREEDNCLTVEALFRAPSQE